MKGLLYAAITTLALAWSSMVRAEAYLLQVAGLSCELCAYSVEHRLGQLEGVQEVRVNLKNGEVVVRTRDGASLTEEQARRVIEGAGFKLTGYQELPDKHPR